MSKREYIDFKLYLTREKDSTDNFQVSLLPTPEIGETVTPITLGFDTLPSPDLFAYLDNKGAITQRRLIKFGKQLANGLLPLDTIRGLFQRAYDHAGPQGGVRLRLIIADHHLKQWPWEYLYYEAPGQQGPMDGFLALNERISIVRHETLPHPHPAAVGVRDDLTEIKMLIASASPDVSDLELQPLNVDEEIGYITEALEDPDVEKVRITFEALPNVTKEQLSLALQQRADIFHFAGHGLRTHIRDDATRDPAKEEIYLLLAQEGASDRVDRLSGAHLLPLLRTASVRLVVLGACYSGRRNERYPWDGIAGELVGGEVPAVIAMQYQVVDTHSIEFTRAFYSALRLGHTLDEAMWYGRWAMFQVSGSASQPTVNVEWGVPVLYTRLSDGALFPERVEHATALAEEFRKTVLQTVAGINRGEMTGVKVRAIQNGVKVVQKIKVQEGTTVGVHTVDVSGGARIEIVQEVDEVGEDGVIIGWEGDVI